MQLRTDENTRAAPTRGSSPRRRLRLALALGALALTALFATPLAHAANRIYWSNFNGNKISYANLDGSGGGDLATGGATVSGPMGMSIDPALGKIYWSNWGDDAAGTTISYANLDGSGGGDLPISPGMVHGPHGLAIDPVAGKIYWPNYADDTISSANIDGSGAENLITDGATVAGPRGVTIDPAAGKIYWANYDGGSGTTISYANLDGSGGGDLMTVGASIEGPEGIALDPAAGRIYWGNFGPGPGETISYANLDGSGDAHDLVTAPLVPGRPHGVALDPATGKIYWADYGAYSIYYANTDGSGGGELTSTGATMDGPVLPALLKVPAGTGAPQISGNITAGSTLGCSEGSWAPDLVTALLYRAPTSFSYQWSRDGADIPGATSTTIIAGSPGDYRCRVRARNEAGSIAQTSAVHTVAPIPKRPTTTVVGCLPPSLLFGAAATCVATTTDTGSGSGSTPTGSVGFSSDTSGDIFSGSDSCVLGPTAVAGRSSCQLTYTPGQIGSGAHQVTVSYGGDATHNAGSGQTTVGVLPPSNAFRIGKTLRNTKKGTLTLVLNVPGPGKLTVKESPGANRHPLALTVVAAGNVGLLVRATGKSRKTLFKRGKARVRVGITYVPTGGGPRTKKKTVALVKRPGRSRH